MATIGCDLDGVVIDLVASWVNAYNLDYGDHLTAEQLLSWDTHLYVKPECGKDIYNYLLRPGLYDHSYPIPLAIAGINFLRDIGHRVIFPTTVQNGVMEGKYNWLKRYNLLPDENDLVVCKDKTLVRMDLLIDDYYKNIEAVSCPGILFDQPHIRYSKGHALPYQAADWGQVLELVDFILNKETENENAQNS